MGRPAEQWGEPEREWSTPPDTDPWQGRLPQEPRPTEKGSDPGEPDSPLDLEASDWKETLRRTIKEVKEDRVSLTAGALAYYWFLSIFPLLIAAVGLVTLLRLPDSTLNATVSAIRTALPDGAQEILVGAVTGASNAADGALIPLIVGLVIALWSASSGVAGMLSGLNIAYDIAEDRKFLKKRFVSLALLVPMLALGGAAAALLVFGEPLGEWIASLLPIGGSIFEVLWTIARVLGALLAITTLMAIFYMFGPNREHPKWQWISPGGVVATLIWLAASVGFGFYVGSFGSYGKTYGALAGVVILILWLYLGALAILVGGELNAELERQSEMRKAHL